MYFDFCLHTNLHRNRYDHYGMAAIQPCFNHPFYFGIPVPRQEHSFLLSFFMFILDIVKLATICDCEFGNVFSFVRRDKPMAMTHAHVQA